MDQSVLLSSIPRKATGRGVELLLKERINEELKTAMKAKAKERISVLRMLLSEIKYAQAAVNVHLELPDDEVLKVITAYHKRLTKSLDDFPEGERRDAVRAELAIIEEYMPKKAGPDEIRRVVDEVLKGTSERVFGPLMKEVLARLGGAGDGKMVSQILKDRLAAN
jgi:uncharacterized protein